MATVSSNKVDVGSLVLQMNADTGQLEHGIRMAESLIGEFQKTAQNVNKYTTSWTTAAEKLSIISVGIKNISNIASSFIQTGIRQFAAFGDTLDKMAKRTGIAASSLSQLKFAAEQSGASLEILDAGMRSLEQKLETKAGGGIFQSLGLDAESLSAMDMEGRLLAIAEAIKNCGDQTRQLKAATDIFGKSGYKLLPMLKEGKAGIEELKKEAERLGISMTEKDVENAAKMTDEINRLKSTLSSVTRSFIATLADDLVGLMGTIRSGISAISEFITNHRTLVNAVAIATTVFVGFTGAIMATTAAFSLLSAPVLLGGLAFAGLIGILAAVIMKLDSTEKHIAKLTETEKNALETGDKMRAADQDKLRRLAELEKKERLNNVEMAEASKIIEQLETKYGKLGLKLDGTTRSLSGVADAQDRVNESMKAAAKLELEAAIAEEERNKRELAEEQGDLRLTRWQRVVVGFGEVTGLDFDGPLRQLDKEYDSLEEKQDIAQKRIDALQARLKALNEGDTSALVDSAGIDAAAESVDKLNDKLTELDKLEESIPDALASAFDDRSPLEKQIDAIKKAQEEYTALCDKARDYNLELAAMATAEGNLEEARRYYDQAMGWEDKATAAEATATADIQKTLKQEQEKIRSELPAGGDGLQDKRDALYRARIAGNAAEVQAAKIELQKAEVEAQKATAQNAYNDREKAVQRENEALQTLNETRQKYGKDSLEATEAERAYVEAVKNTEKANATFNAAADQAFQDNVEEAVLQAPAAVAQNSFQATFGTGYDHAQEQLNIQKAILNWLQNNGGQPLAEV